MKTPRLWSWVRSPWKDPLADLIDYYGPEFTGSYGTNAGRVVGRVASRSDGSRFQPASIVVVRDGQQIGATEQFERRGDGWNFEIESGCQFTAKDIVQDRISAFAIDQLGHQHQLRLDGATQLRCIIETVAPTELVIDFSRGGNSRQYLMEGWSGQEPGQIWTLGKVSTIAINFAAPGSRYRLQIVASPFVVREKLLRQTMEISISGFSISGFSLGAAEPLHDSIIPAELTREGQAVLRIEHPDAARPCDVSSSKEKREIAFAFKRLTLCRYLETP